VIDQQFIFNFKQDLSELEIPDRLNNPFGNYIPKLAHVAAQELQQYLDEESTHWTYDFQLEKGKMFGVLVVQLEDDSLKYLGTVSGKLLGDVVLEKLVPSVFKVSTGDYFINKGMTELTEIGAVIKQTQSATRVDIFSESVDRSPPSAAGECAAPKLLHYALENKLKPVALAEFWWGNSETRKDRIHKKFYPACRDKCWPILEYMLEDDRLYGERVTRRFI